MEQPHQHTHKVFLCGREIRWTREGGAIISTIRWHQSNNITDQSVYLNIYDKLPKYILKKCKWIFKKCKWILKTNLLNVKIELHLP